MDFAAIQAEVPQLEHSGGLGHQQDLHKQLLDLIQKRLAKMGDRIVIRMQSASDETKGNTFVGGFLNLARTEHPAGISIEQQPQQDFRRNRLPAHRRILPVDPAQVKPSNDIHHKARQVLERQCISQTDRLIQCFFVIGGLEFSTHAQSLPVHYLRECFKSSRVRLGNGHIHPNLPD